MMLEFIPHWYGINMLRHYKWVNVSLDLMDYGILKDGVMSESYTVERGVKQGSVLSLAPEGLRVTVHKTWETG